MSRYTIHHGDVLETLRTLEGNSCDALLSDAPYGLRFMGKNWDISVPSVDVWREAIRVLKPGAPILVFGGTRTFHRLVCAIEDAGFEIRDQIDWVYGSGFPKSLDLSKAIDQANGDDRPIVGEKAGRPRGGMGKNAYGDWPKQTSNPLSAAASAASAAYDGYGTALKPAHEPICFAMKPLEGTYAANVAKWGVGGLAIDASRIQSTDALIRPQGQPVNAMGSRKDGSGRTDEPSGRWPANVILSHSMACRPTGSQRRIKANPAWNDNRGPSSFTGGETSPVRHTDENGTEAIEQWECVDDCPVNELDRQSGSSGSTSRPRVNLASRASPSFPMGQRVTFGAADDSVGASRFFYVAKASRAERDFGCEGLRLVSAAEMTDRTEGDAALSSPRTGAGRSGGARNVHPTVKPIALARYLARMILPPPRADGKPRRLLLPYSGSGSEIVGALRAGWDHVTGIEAEVAYIEIAHARIARWLEAPAHIDEGEITTGSEPANERQVDLFAKVAK